MPGLTLIEVWAAKLHDVAHWIAEVFRNVLAVLAGGRNPNLIHEPMLEWAERWDIADKVERMHDWAIEQR